MILSTQLSLAFLTRPLVSYTEMSIPLPAAKSLWNARSATEWRSVYIALPAEDLAHLPPFRSCVEDFSSLLTMGDAVDTRCTTLAVLSGLWLNTWQYKERLNAESLARTTMQAKNALIVHSLQREAREVLEDFKALYEELAGPMGPALRVLYERQLIHLHASIEDVQLLGGKAGEEEARRVLPRLSEWASSRACRQALWHAGQVLQAGQQDRDSTLRSSTVIAMYHASLTLWASSVLSRTQSLHGSAKTSFQPHQQQQQQQQGSPASADDAQILLNGEYSAAVQRFLLVGSGRAVISHWSSGSESDVQHAHIDISREPAMMMKTIGDSLCEKYLQMKYSDCPGLVVNLSRLIGQLGHAAEVMQHSESQLT